MDIDKHSNFSEWFSTVLKDAKLVDLRYNVKGFIVILPWAFKTMKLMYNFAEAELEKRNHNPVNFPVVIPESNLIKEEEHVKGFGGEVFWITHAGFNKLEEKLALRPTSETAMYPLYALWIKGKSDLPIKMYQSGAVWRYETKATRPFIRGREFLWIETHDAFATKNEALNQVMEDIEILNVFLWDILGIPFIVLRRPQWDKFPGADDTYAADTLMPDGKVLQIATTHMLGQKFSKPFNIKFMDEDGKEKFVWQTCFGIGMNRIYAALVAWHGDNKGLIYPFNLSPIQIVIVPIFKEENREKVLKYAKQVYKKLKNKGFRVLLDDSDKTPGFKFNEWEFKGVPIRIEVGEKEINNEGVLIVPRDTGIRSFASLNELVDNVMEESRAMMKRLKEKNWKEFENSLKSALSFEELKKKLEKGGIVRVPFCSLSNGVECYNKIKEELKAEVRGEKVGEGKPQGLKCIVCGKEANHFVYVARQY